MKKIILTLSALALSTTLASAGQPDQPGAFGRDRAAGVHSFQGGGSLDTGAAGASEWGKIAAERAGSNGTINQDYKDANGGSPNPANDNGSGNSIY